MATANGEKKEQRIIIKTLQKKKAKFQVNNDSLRGAGWEMECVWCLFSRA